MNRSLNIWVIAICWGCAYSPADSSHNNSDTKALDGDSAYVWTKLADSAAWEKSYNFQMFSIRDTIWTFHADGTWYSLNGIDWNKSSLTNIIHNQAFLDYVFFKDAVYGLGRFDGNIEQFRLQPSIYRSADLRHWDTLSQISNLPKRFFYHPFVFNNKIWIIGGEDKNTAYSDIWSSDDGIVWRKQKDNLPFGKAGGAQVVLFHGKLFLLRNDVWASDDAMHWQQVTPEIIKGEEIFGYSAQVMDNKIWLLGCNRNGHFSSQVLMSEDGKHWHGFDAPWTPRGGIAATVHKNAIYITGGKYGGTPQQPDFHYSNDIWKLEKKQ